MDNYNLSLMMSGGIAVFSIFNLLNYNENFFDRINNKKKNYQLNVIGYSQIEIYLDLINEINNNNYILINLKENLIIFELIYEYTDRFLDLFCTSNNFKVNFETSDNKFDEVINTYNLITQLEEINKTEINFKKIFDGNYEFKFLVGRNNNNCGFIEKNIKVKSLKINDLIIKIMDNIDPDDTNYDNFDTNTLKYLINDSDFSVIKYKDLIFNDKEKDDIKQMKLAKDSSTIESYRNIEDKHIELVFIIYHFNDQIADLIKNYKNILENEKKKITLVKDNLELMVSELNKKKDVLEKEDMFIKNYLEKYKKTHI